jgi:hypothetical protein
MSDDQQITKQITNDAEENPIAEQVAERREKAKAMEEAGLPAPPWAEGGGSDHTGTPASGPSEFDEVRAAGLGTPPEGDDGELERFREIQRKAEAEGKKVEQAPEGAVELSKQMAEQAASEPESEQTVVEQEGTGITQEPSEGSEPEYEPAPTEPGEGPEAADEEAETVESEVVEDSPELMLFEQIAEKLQNGEWAVIDDRLVVPATGEDLTDRVALSDDHRAELGLPPNAGALVPYSQPPAVIEDAEEVEAEADEVEKKGLFDKTKYDDPRLVLQTDNRNIDKIAVSFAGTVTLDRNNPDHVDVIRQAKIGAEMSMAIAGVDGTWIGHADVAKTTEDGYVEEVTRTVKLKVTDVVFDQVDGG